MDANLQIGDGGIDRLHATVNRCLGESCEWIARMPQRPADARPTCLIVEDDAAVRQMLTLLLDDCDLTPCGCTSARNVAETCAQHAPDIVFLDLALRGFDAIDVLRALGAQGYRGAVQLISGHHGLLTSVTNVGERAGLTMLRPLRKPFRREQVRQAIEGLGAAAERPI